MMQADVLEVVQAVRAEVAKGWTQGTNQIDESGHWVARDSPMVVARCLYGALLYGALVYATNFPLGRYPLLDTAYATIAAEVRTDKDQTMNSLVAWNDAKGRTQDEVLDMLDKLIAKGSNEETK